jgi:hypothetical protein|tara:strand:+ start:382 stop:660 length:279 start_codon:yes stop_codon:yes gene_type:complete
MIVSECCGAKLKEHESVICSCCSEHTSAIEEEKESILVIDEEFNWSQYQMDIFNKRIKSHGSVIDAVVAMDAQISSLKLETKILKEMNDYEQ